MGYSFVEHTAAALLVFVILETAVFGWYFVTSRISLGGSYDRFAVAVSRWDGKSAMHGIAVWQIAAVSTYFAIFGQA